MCRINSPQFLRYEFQACFLSPRKHCQGICFVMRAEFNCSVICLVINGKDHFLWEVKAMSVLMTINTYDGTKRIKGSGITTFRLRYDRASLENIFIACGNLPVYK